MNDTKRSGKQGGPAWLLLIPQLPPKPDYLRVKLRRRIQRIGAVSLRNAVYVLPNREATMEDFVWLRSEIKADEGDAIICAADTVAGVTDAEIIALFNESRDADYREIADEASEVSKSTDPGDLEREALRLRRRIEEIDKVDFFDSSSKSAARQAVDSLTHRDPKPKSGKSRKSEFTKRTWVTRKGVFIDRIASAWLIRRFIDRSATFKFVAASGYSPRKGELRFDMYHGEFTHRGDHCTFETLIESFALDDDAALRAIAEIVHDIDIKDGKFERPETSGVELVIAGVAASHTRDADRINAGTDIFDSLYEQLRVRKHRT